MKLTGSVVEWIKVIIIFTSSKVTHPTLHNKYKQKYHISFWCPTQKLLLWSQQFIFSLPQQYFFIFQQRYVQLKWVQISLDGQINIRAEVYWCQKPEPFSALAHLIWSKYLKDMLTDPSQLVAIFQMGLCQCDTCDQSFTISHGVPTLFLCS